ncbi:hypothetical protein ACLB1G_20645 [Oxalobacteraceae bacterium A2-2]
MKTTATLTAPATSSPSLMLRLARALRRVFELSGAPYANGPLPPL